MKVGYRYQPMPVAHYIAANFLDLFSTWTIYGGYAVKEDNTTVQFEKPVEMRHKSSDEATYVYNDGSSIHYRRGPVFTRLVVKNAEGVVLKRYFKQR